MSFEKEIFFLSPAESLQPAYRTPTILSSKPPCIRYPELPFVSVYCCLLIYH